MAEMVCSALVQETVSRGVSFALGKREEKASHGHLKERLEIAVSELEFALERAQELPIRHLSLIVRRKQIKSAYVEATELLDKHKQQRAVPSGLELQQGVKRKRRWILRANNMSFTSSFATLSTDDVRRFEWYADCAGKYVRDVESGCSLHHNTFCNPIIRHLLEGKTLQYFLQQGNLRRVFHIWPMYSDERGLEVVLAYLYDDRTMAEKNFRLMLLLRLSESTDIAGVAIKGLQLFTSEFKLAAECAMGEVTLLSNLQDIAHSYGPPWVGIQEWCIYQTQFFRPDPACCKGSRHGFCANNNVSSEFSEIFPEQVIYWGFQCNYVPALGPRSSRSSFDVVGGRKSRGSGKPPRLLTASFEFAPHYVIDTEDNYNHEIFGDGDVIEYSRDASIQQLAVALKSDAINCFFRHLELTEYKIVSFPRHGGSWFWMQKASMEKTGIPKSNRRYNRRERTRLLGLQTNRV